jgi:hypothetical protein
MATWPRSPSGSVWVALVIFEGGKLPIDEPKQTAHLSRRADLLRVAGFLLWVPYTYTSRPQMEFQTVPRAEGSSRLSFVGSPTRLERQRDHRLVLQSGFGELWSAPCAAGDSKR